MVKIILQKVLRGVKLIQQYRHIKRVNNNQLQIPTTEGQKLVFFDLKDIGLEIYYYTLLFSFHEAGYFVLIKDNLWFLANCPKIASKLSKLPNKKIISNIKKIRPENCIFLHDLRTKYNLINWKKNIHINLDIYSTVQNRNNFIVHPFHMAPHIYEEGLHKSVYNLRNSTKTMKVFFSGNQDRNAYSGSFFDTYFKKLNRVQVIDTLIKHLDSDNLYLANETDSPPKKYLNKFVLFRWIWSVSTSENLSIRIKNEEWLIKLASSHFFLCPPGVIMPPCFHTIEAMSVGTIPILEYPEFFNPPLEHLKNAIIFSGKQSLIEMVNLVLTLSTQEIEVMSKNVCEYYDRYLQPCVTINLIEESRSPNIELYINAEGKSFSKEIKKALHNI